MKQCFVIRNKKGERGKGNGTIRKNRESTSIDIAL
jgi:hypothetical protein